MGPMRAERGSASSASGECIGTKTLLRAHNLYQHVHKMRSGTDCAHVASFPAYLNSGPVPPGCEDINVVTSYTVPLISTHSEDRLA
jgi:hypothetical protein